MNYYTIRNGLRKGPDKSYDIDPRSFSMLLKCCEKYLINLAWKFPSYCCEDMRSIVDFDKKSLIDDLSIEIPSLIEDGDFVKPGFIKNVFEEETRKNYDPFSILDFIEYVFENLRDFEDDCYHDYWMHSHLTFRDSYDVRNYFVKDINHAFNRAGLLYLLRENGEIRRTVSNQAELDNVKEKLNDVKDRSLKELIDESLNLYLKPGAGNIGLAVERIWDAFERSKTIYRSLDKKRSAEKVLEVISEGEESYKSVLENEMEALTYIGNNFRIRHHETNKIDLVSDCQREYFFNRCLSIMLLIIKLIK